MTVQYEFDPVERGPLYFHKYDEGAIMEKKVFSPASSAFCCFDCDWNLARRGITVVRNVLKTERAVNPDSGGKVTGAINGLGLISVFNLINAPGRIYDGCRDVRNCLIVDDYEWAALSGLEVATAAGDGVDAGLVFTSCLHGLCEKIPFSSELANIMLPFAIALNSVGMVLKGAEIYQTKQFIKQLNGKCDPIKDIGQVIKKTGEYKGRIREVTNAVNQINIHKVKCCTSPQFAAYPQRDQGQLIGFAEKKITIGYVSLTANSVQLCAYAMFFFPIIPAPIPLFLLTAASVAKLGIYYYEKQLRKQIQSQEGSIRSSATIP